MPARDQAELVLVHSPLTGDVTWGPVADVLRARGRAVSVPSLTQALGGRGPYYPKLLATAAEQTGPPRPHVRPVASLAPVIPVVPAAPVVLVGHSGAGPLLPALRERLAAGRRPVAGTVYADAQWPHPGQSWLQVVPEDLRAQVVALARDGQLPPWDQWFSEEVLAEELPDPEVRAWFRAGVPRLPLAYLEERAPGADVDPDHSRSAYLRLSPTYEETAMRAEAIGHRVLRRTSHHLGLVTDPEGTADAIEKLAHGFAARRNG
ncbi:hypothetical protein [Streptomyces axinellae]|uniref:Alpha/beta hydrolase n=1 Tax=Streptomyces axinellae TaxID=552788 RepID=A0ABP6CQX9_9ACTN